MYKIILASSLSLFSFVLVKSQTTLLQDKQGETSLLINNQKVISVNAGDANASVSLSYATPAWFTGVSSKFKATDGISKLLDGNKLNPDVEFSLFGGFSVSRVASPNYSFVYIAINLINTNYKILKTDNSNLFDDKHFAGPSIKIGYNSLSSLPIFRPAGGVNSSIIWGVSADISKINNILDLDDVTTYTTTNASSGASTISSQTDKKTGYIGEYAESTALQIKADGYLYPQILGGNLGVGGYLRSQITGHSPRNNLGAGIVFGQTSAPGNIVISLLYQFNDVFNQLGKENNFFKRGGINLIAGYKF